MFMLRVSCEERFMKRQGKIMVTMAACALAGAMAVGGTFAYLTDSEGSVNTFTVGSVQIDLEEPGWNPDDTTDIVPNEVIRKDPKIENTGTNAAYAFAEVKIPAKTIILAGADGTKQPEGVHDLFTYGTVTSTDGREVYTAGGLNEGWSLIQSQVAAADGYSTYIFGYRKPLAKGETTLTVFDRVKFANIVEGQIDSQDVDIPVKAYAIQAGTSTDGVTTTIDGVTVADASHLTDEEMLEIYTVFARQNDTLKDLTTAGGALKDADTNGAKDLSGADRN